MSDAESTDVLDFIVIGGSHDGEVISLPADAFQRHERICIPSKESMHDVQFPKNSETSLPTEYYRLGIITSPGGENQFPVLIIDSMPYEQAITIFLKYMAEFVRQEIAEIDGLHAHLIAQGQRIGVN